MYLTQLTSERSPAARSNYADSIDIAASCGSSTENVVPRRGPTPTPEQVEESIVKLLHSDEMHATIDLPDGSFEAASFNVVSAEANAEKLS